MFAAPGKTKVYKERCTNLPCGSRNRGCENRKESDDRKYAGA